MFGTPDSPADYIKLHTPILWQRPARPHLHVHSFLPHTLGHTGRMVRSSAVVIALLGAYHASGFVVDPASGALARARVRHGASSTVEMSAAPKLVPFSKYQGLGNDFILVDNREAEEPKLTAGESADLCDRCVVDEATEKGCSVDARTPQAGEHDHDPCGRPGMWAYGHVCQVSVLCCWRAVVGGWVIHVATDEKAAAFRSARIRLQAHSSRERLNMITSRDTAVYCNTRAWVLRYCGGEVHASRLLWFS